MEVKLPSKPQSVRGGGALSQARANKLYSLKDKHVVSLFKLLQKSNKFKLPEIRRPEEVGRLMILTTAYITDVGTPYQELLHLQGCSSGFDQCRGT